MENYNTESHVQGSHVAPKYQEFSYSEAEIKKDQAKVQKIKRDLEIETQKKEKTSSFAGVENAESARQVELSVMDTLDDDLFQEWAPEEDFSADEDFNSLNVVPTIEFDDFVNHIDIICVAKNKLTDGRPVPFLLDTTYNADDKALDKKFHHTHFKHPNLLGLQTAKYYKDTDTLDDSDAAYPTGRIGIAPRFVVGYSPDLADDFTPMGDDKKKLVLLTQLTDQSRGILQGISKEYPEISAAPGDIKQVAGDLVALDKYFNRAKNLFLSDLKSRSEEMSEMPADRNYGNPTGYYDSVMRYIRSSEDQSYQAISGKIDAIYPQKSA